MAGITSDLAKKVWRGVSGGSLDNFRRDIIAGSHGKKDRMFVCHARQNDFSVKKTSFWQA